jgi:hypothetical protein
LAEVVVNLGSPELLILGLVILGLVIWVVVDASSRPEWVWQRTGQNRVVWIAVPLVGLVFCGVVSLVMAIVYLASIRPQLIAAQQGSP